VHNFERGDRIYLFGYSRGAFTARSLAGCIRNCGILKKNHADRIPQAFSLYRNRRDDPGSAKSISFRKRFSYETDIAFVGVWDTVGALGIPFKILRRHNLNKYRFHDTSLSSSINYACHALAIDEMRRDFAPTLWTNKRRSGLKVVQTWFAGSHGDVGGGHAETGLSDNALDWMMKHAQKAGLCVDMPYLRKIMHRDALGPLHASRKGIYSIRGKHVRPMGESPIESIHPSVKKRWNAGRNYRPANLKKCLKLGLLRW
jgi:uncharacterized protein (DUF2235 family)